MYFEEPSENFSRPLRESIPNFSTSGISACNLDSRRQPISLVIPSCNLTNDCVADGIITPFFKGKNSGLLSNCSKKL